MLRNERSKKLTKEQKRPTEFFKSKILKQIINPKRGLKVAKRKLFRKRKLKNEMKMKKMKFLRKNLKSMKK